MAQQTVRVKVTAQWQNFNRAVAQAKRLHGKFDGASKTWLIPASMAQYVRPADGLRIVDDTADTNVEHCTRWTADQGCPLHGEVCR